MSAASRLVHYRRLESQLAAAEQAVAAKRREIDDFLVKLSGIEPGDLVIMPDGKTARVVEVMPDMMRPGACHSADTGEFGKPWLRVNIRKVDGTWSHAVRMAYTWAFACRPTTPAPRESA